MREENQPTCPICGELLSYEEYEDEDVWTCDACSFYAAEPV